MLYRFLQSGWYKFTRQKRWDKKLGEPVNIQILSGGSILSCISFRISEYTNKTIWLEINDGGDWLMDPKAPAMKHENWWWWNTEHTYIHTNIAFSSSGGHEIATIRVSHPDIKAISSKSTTTGFFLNAILLLFKFHVPTWITKRFSYFSLISTYPEYQTAWKYKCKVWLTREWHNRTLQPATIEGNAVDSGEKRLTGWGWVRYCAAALSRETDFS